MGSHVMGVDLAPFFLLSFVTLCNAGLDWHFRPGQCLMAAPTTISPALDIVACQQLCELETTFNCKAAAFSSTGSQCYLWTTSSSHVNTTGCPEGADGMYEVITVKLWETFSRRTLLGYDGRTVINTTIEECKLLCQEEQDFRCLSIDHDGSACTVKWESQQTVELYDSSSVEHFSVVQLPAWQHRPGECVEEGSPRKVIIDLYPRDCLAACALEPQFECLAVNYKNVTHTCELYDKAKVNNDTESCSTHTIHYYGKKQRSMWRRVQNACTARQYSQAIENVTPHGCLELCEVYYPATCRSVMYQRAPPGPTMCYIFDDDTQGDGLYMNPCPDSDVLEIYTPRYPDNCQMHVL